jgi:hypothetical protein
MAVRSEHPRRPRRDDCFVAGALACVPERGRDAWAVGPEELEPAAYRPARWKPRTTVRRPSRHARSSWPSGRILRVPPRSSAFARPSDMALNSSVASGTGLPRGGRHPRGAGFSPGVG